MGIERELAAWRADGIITSEQEAMLAVLVRKERFSIHLELSSLLYLGVLVFVGGLGWTVREHFASAGDALVLTSLAVIFGFSLWYCFTRDPQMFGFDYVLYLGCLTFSVALGYLEFRFHLLKDQWDAYLFASAGLYFALAYRFDNRFVLSLALSTLAGWFGIRLSTWRVFSGSIRGLMLLYSVMVSTAGTAMYRARIKPHFLEAYLHVAVNAALLALTSGTFDFAEQGLWLAMLVLAAGVCVASGVWFRRFTFVVYGVVYAYVGISARAMRELHNDTALLTYFVVSGVVVVAALFAMARRTGRS